MTKLIVAFRDFARAAEMHTHTHTHTHTYIYIYIYIYIVNVFALNYFSFW
jgi:hypothetical protein